MVRGKNSNSFSVIAGITLALVILFVTAIALAIWSLRSDAIQDANTDTSNIAAVFSNQIARSIQSVDIILSDVRDQVRAQSPQGSDELSGQSRSYETFVSLQKYLDRLPQADLIAFTDKNGRIANGTTQWPPADLNLADRDYFQRAKENRDDKIYISNVIKSRISGAKTVFFSKRVDGPNGEFLGVVFIGLRLSYFEAVYSSITPLRNQTFVLAHPDGTILVRYPDLVDRAGQKMPAGSPWYKLAASGGGNYWSPGYFDGDPRYVSVRPIAGYPLVANISVTQSAALANWRNRATQIAFGVVVVLVFAIFLLVLLRQKFSLVFESEAMVREYDERERLFVAAVESSNDAIVTKTLDGVITGWNQAAELLFGFSSQEAIGKRIDLIVPSELNNEVHEILKKISNGEKIQHHETVRINRDGKRIDVSLSVSPIKSQSGAIIGAAKVARDITAKKKALQDLLDSEQMAKAIIDSAIDAFIQFDDTDTVIDWSPKAETMFGWRHQEAIGKKLCDLIVPPANRVTYSEKMDQFLLGAKNGILDKRYDSQSMRRDGSTIENEISLSALRRRDGFIVSGFVRDITDKLAAEDQLRQAQKMESVGQLTGGIAHDFNNMLTVITGTIDILGDAVADKPHLVAIAKLISEAADRGAELTGHLLAFARKQPLQPRDTDVNALMTESGKLLRPALGENVEIELRLKEAVWPALVDRGQLTTALLNLAVNARDAMPNGGKLTLETSNVVLDQSYAAVNAEVQPGNYVLIAVSDTGTGMPEAIRLKVFEPFFTTKGVGKGTGLGLSMVYGFVKQSGGHIKIYSEEGHGTTFKIYLPRAGAQPEQVAETLREASIGGGSETILVVEDEALVRASALTQLQSLGYKTLSATNGAEALAIADRGEAFDLLFTDMIMPGQMNGRQLAEEMAKRRSPLKVLFTSGYTEDAVIHHGRLDPGVLLLTKPYRKKDLAQMIRKALEATSFGPSRSVA